MNKQKLLPIVTDSSLYKEVTKTSLFITKCFILSLDHLVSRKNVI